MAMNYDFEWDPRKAQSNQRKHAVHFEEAATIFLDPMALTIYDPDHSDYEDRWITLGISRNGRLLLVCHTFHEMNPDSVTIHIFSSRKANKTEGQSYGEQE